MSKIVSHKQLTTGFSSGSHRAHRYRLPATSRLVLGNYPFLRPAVIGAHESKPKLCSAPQGRCPRFLRTIRNYSVIQIYTPHAPSARLEADHPATDGASTTEPRPDTNQHPSLANDKVENWSSSAYAHLPYQPDFTLFEPIVPPHTSPEGNVTDHTTLGLKSRIDTNLCERLAYLIHHDSYAAEQLKSEIVKNAIELPANFHITSYCFDLLFRHHNISAYLEWLPLVASCHLQQINIADQRPPISTAEIHLNQLLKLVPYELQSVLHFLNVLIAKKCFSKHLSFTTIRHLVRTQVPATSISLTEKISTMLKIQPVSQDLVKPSQDFLILQLANQGYLSEAWELFYEKQPASMHGSKHVKTYPLLYRVLADQLLSRIKRDTSTECQQWTSKLEKLVSLWHLDHESSLHSWLTPETSKYIQSPSPPSLTKHTSEKYQRVFSNVVSVNPQVCQEFSLDKLVHFAAYFRSLFDSNHHPKFVKAAKLANELHQILPLRQSFLDLQEKLELDESAQKTEEQLLKSILLEPPALLREMLVQTTNQRVPTPPTFQLETRSDIAFLWAHSWMIFYHRSGRPLEAMKVFLEYFIPLGCDLKLLDRLQRGPNEGDTSPHIPCIDSATGSQSYRHPKNQKLIHPTTGVITVLYDSILAISPHKLINVIFESFLVQHYHRASESSPILDSSFSFNKRLIPNLGSFRPFVKAFLKFDDVDGAVRVLESMHFHLGQAKEEISILENEGGWIDLLEWCALNSSGPKPKKFDTNYHWGDNRKKKLMGWDGRMKEDLIFLVLNKFFLSKSHPHNHAASHGQPSLEGCEQRNFWEKPQQNILSRRVTSLGNADEIRSKLESIMFQERKIFQSQDVFIEERLKFLDNNNNNNGKNSSTLLQKLSLNFPSLKLILKIRFGFYLSKNSKGLKFINKLLTCYK